LPDANVKNGAVPQLAEPGCSQSVLVKATVAPSLTVVLIACLCACVDIPQNLRPAGTLQVIVSTSFIAPGGTLIWPLYVT
jgi:hypothetical protein